MVEALAMLEGRENRLVDEVDLPWFGGCGLVGATVAKVVRAPSLLMTAVAAEPEEEGEGEFTLSRLEELGASVGIGDDALALREECWGRRAGGGLAWA